MLKLHINKLMHYILTWTISEWKFDFQIRILTINVYTFIIQQQPYISVAFSRYKSVSLSIFVSFQKKIAKSKYRYFYFRKLTQKNSINIFFFYYWNPYLKTDSANLLILFSVNDFHKKICRNFYVIFYVIFPTIMYVSHLEKHKMQKIEKP